MCICLKFKERRNYSHRRLMEVLKAMKALWDMIEEAGKVYILWDCKATILIFSVIADDLLSRENKIHLDCFTCFMLW